MSQVSLFHDFCPCGCFDSFDHQEVSLVKEFEYWFLILNHQQGFLGRSILILKSHKTDEIELLQEEVLEKHHIYCLWRKAINQAFKPDKINQSQLGNEEHLHGGHLHWHWIPRYRRPMCFEGVTFLHDTLQTQKLNYSRIVDRTVHSVDIRIKIRDVFKKYV